MIRVFLLDDDELVRLGVRYLLASADDLEVVGEADTVATAIERAPAALPDVALLDVQLPDGTGIEVCRELRSLVPGLRCLMLTSLDNDESEYQAMMAGASGYLLKNVSGAALVTDIRRVAAGEILLDPLAAERVLERLRNPPRDVLMSWLSPRELALVRLITEGLTDGEIAERMSMSERTVKGRVSALLGKLGLRNRTAADIQASRLAL